MSWSKLNGFELQAVRKALNLDVSEAAEGIGKVSNRTWQYWEAGRSNVPDDIDMEMYGLIEQRTELIDALMMELEPALDNGAKVKWYHTFPDFIADYPSCNKVMWRLHQSVCSFVFTENDEIELRADIKTDNTTYLFKWFNRLHPEQIQWDRLEEKVKELGI